MPFKGTKITERDAWVFGAGCFLVFLLFGLWSDLRNPNPDREPALQFKFEAHIAKPNDCTGEPK